MSSATINNPIDDPRFMNAYMVAAMSIRDTAKERSIGMETGDAHAMARRLLLALKKNGYVLKTEKAA